MAKGNHTKIVLTEENDHLIDIFYDDYYLELGNISYNVLEELLNKKLVSYSRITYFNIENKGIGSFASTNQEIRNKLPFVFFQNLVQQNRSNQLVITYGLLVRRKGYKEFFTPMVLIPVNMYFENNDIYFQLISNPIENPLLKTDRGLYIDLLNSEKLDSIYSLDRYCMSFIKHKKMNVRLESYLTIVNTRQKEMTLNHEQFSIDVLDTSMNEIGYSVEGKQDTYPITPLNRQQRIALQKIHSGNSFAILGYDGTGKTTTLINAASDALAQGKRVLYVSNHDKTLEQVSKVFKEHQLDIHVANLQGTFSSLLAKTPEIKKSQIIDIVLKNEIRDKYQKVKDYEKLLSNRFMNFRFIDILKELVLVNSFKPENAFPSEVLDKSETLYKHEIEEVVESLSIIDKELKKMDSFKNSKFINIPINHTIKNAQQLIDLLEKIKNLYQNLNKYKEDLETKYGFNEIANYARFRNIIHNFNQIKMEMIPSIWMDINSKNELHSFKRAKSLFKELKNEINSTIELQEQLNAVYHKESLENFNVNQAIENILSTYFDEKDQDNINNFLQANPELNKTLSFTMNQIEICDSCLKRISERLKWTLSFKNIEGFVEVCELVQFLNKGIFSLGWLELEEEENVVSKLKSLEQSLNELTAGQKLYQQYFDNNHDLDSNIAFLEKKYHQKGASYKYKGAEVVPLIKNLKAFRSLKEKENELKENYRQFTGTSFIETRSLLPEYHECVEKLKAIRHVEYRKRFVKALKTVKPENMARFFKQFNLFYRSYINICDSYNELIHYHLAKETKDFVSKINQLRDIYQYCVKVLIVEQDMERVTRKQLSQITFQDYLDLATKTNQLYELKTKIDKNKTYTHLFTSLFNGYQTNINQLENIISLYSLYVDIFKDSHSVVNSFKDDIHNGIEEILQQASSTIEETNEYFKLYYKYFKDGVGKYYYDDFNSVVNMLDDLIVSKDELQIYLKVTNQMKVLLEHKLNALNQYIIDHDREVFRDRFVYTYFTSLYNRYIQMYPQVINTSTYIDLLKQIKALEKELLESNTETIKNKKSTHTNIGLIKNLNYNQYVIKSANVKSIFLTDTQIANYYLDINLFDLVLIDDAHLLHANEYCNVIQGKQVVIAGMEKMQTSISSSLLSRIRSNSIMRLKYRYIPTPLSLLKQINNIHGRFYSDVKKNQGISIVSGTPLNVLIELYKDNPKSIVNFFTPSLSDTREIYQKLTQIFVNEGYNEKNIFSFYRNQLNVCDLKLGYFYDADFNILDLKQYSSLDDEYSAINMVNTLLSCHRQLIILDADGYLENDIDTHFMRNLKNIIHQSTEPVSFVMDDVVTKLADDLAKYKIKAIGSYNQYSLIVQFHQRYYGIMLFEDPKMTEFEILNHYRSIGTGMFPTIAIWIVEWATHPEQTIEKIVREIYRG